LIERHSHSAENPAKKSKKNVHPDSISEAEFQAIQQGMIARKNSRKS
jgi:hypothetical protein